MATPDVGVDGWDFKNYHVQRAIDPNNFVNAESILFAAGPPRLADSSKPLNSEPANVAYPIGVIENAGIGQGKQIQRIFEIGSSRSYFIPGRVIGTLNIGRILNYGPSLMRMLYASYAPTSEEPGYPLTANVLGNTVDKTTVMKQMAGYDGLWLNLASNIFNYPFGMLCYFKDVNEGNYGGFYMQDCLIQGNQFSINAGSVLALEGASCQFESIAPIKMTFTPIPEAA